MSRNKKGWSASELKRRGWTNGMMRDLLPAPRRFSAGGTYFRLWDREAVLAAEQDPGFRERKEGSPPHAAVGLADALSAVWERAEGTEFSMPETKDAALELARRYHHVLTARLRDGSGVKAARTKQAPAYLGEFLALERRGDGTRPAGGAHSTGSVRPTAGTRLTEILKNFLRAGNWIEDHGEHPLVMKLKERYSFALYAGARQELEDFSAAQPGKDIRAMLDAENFPERMLLADGLGTVWSVWYVPRAIRTSLSLLVALHPKDEYPEARAMKRHFILHLGGTNTGKTYAGFQRLMRVPTGVYLAPLRLLALEAQETLLDAGVDCGLTTGEEEDLREDDTHIAATAEKLDLRRRFDAAVIDECQMVADRQRGYAWTRAILGVLAPEIHLCAAPEAQHLLMRMIESCGDTYEVEFHHRRTPLVCMNHTVDYTRVQPGDALITFSKLGALSVAEDLRQAGKEPAILYGALPYATRRRQMEGFLEGKMRYVVATDAIGMGLNLPIRRIIFMETEKFDGVERRDLKPEEIKQIAGRAGRYGMYDRGYVGATENLSAVRAGLDAVVPPLQEAVAGFSDLVLNVDFDLLEVLTEWSKMPTAEPYVKLDITRYLSLITRIRERGFRLDREEELRAANIPFDETEEALRELFFHFLELRERGEEPEMPELPEEGGRTLPALEQYYRKLDLYFSFAKTFGIPVDMERLRDQREGVAGEINDILLHRLRDNIRFCAKCGKALPLHHKGRLCNDCFRSTRRGRQRWQEERG